MQIRSTSGEIDLSGIADKAVSNIPDWVLKQPDVEFKPIPVTPRTWTFMAELDEMNRITLTPENAPPGFMEHLSAQFMAMHSWFDSSPVHVIKIVPDDEE